jgi:Holliday junction resolvase
MSYLAGVSSIINSAFVNSGKTLPGEAECDSIDIKGRYIVIQTDHKDFKEKVINTLFTAGNQRCVCDYILIADTCVLVCELKSNNEGKMKTQLKNTGRLVHYLLETVKEHCKIAAQIPTVKYVCFASKYSSAKQGAKAGRLNGIKWNGSELFQLPCGANYHLNQFN